jgi:hypothetical protein
MVFRMFLAFFILKRNGMGDKGVTIPTVSPPPIAVPQSNCFLKKPLSSHPQRIDNYLKAIEEDAVDEYHSRHNR